MIEKKVRMTVEISVLVHEISRGRGPLYHRLPESLRTLLTSDECREVVERQSRLQRALLENVEAFRMYLLHAVTSDFDLTVGSAINNTLDIPTEEEILKSVTASMASEDDLYFRQVTAEGHGFENTELMEVSIVTDWESVRLLGVEVLA